jgi:hypothetical protein
VRGAQRDRPHLVSGSPVRATCEDFDRYFVRSNRPHAVPRPGLALSRRWPLQEAQVLDRDDGLRREVRQALDDALGALGGRAVGGR